jgi:hypothetical protein
MTDADALLSFLCIAATLLLFYGPWQSLCTDVARQLIFEQRSALFDMARTGRLRFDSPEYREIRQDLERLIRFSHELTLPRVIYLAIMLPMVRQRGLRSPALDAIARLGDKDLERDITRIILKSYTVSIAMMIAKSWIGILLIPAAMVPLMVGAAKHRFRARTKPYIVRIGSVIQAEAECTNG